MAYNTIRNPGIANGFSILADAFNPDPNRLIQADLARGRRDEMLATQHINEQKLAQMREQQANQVLVQSILAGNPDFKDPAQRADFMSALAGTDGGLQYGPKFATGASTYVDPQFADPNDFSNILLGTGVVNGYGQTPAGAAADNAASLARQNASDAAAFERAKLAEQGANTRNDASLANALTREHIQQDGSMARTRVSEDAAMNRTRAGDEAANTRNQDSLANALTRTQMEQDGAMARQQYQTDHGTGGSRAPLDVSPQDTAQMLKLINDRLHAMFPDVDPKNMDPTVASALLPRVSQLYQQSRNAELAIQQALGEIPMETYWQDDSWLPTGDTQHLRPAQVPAAGAPAPAAASPGAAVAPAAAPGAIQEGATAVNKQTGQRIIYRGGQWVPM